MGYGNKEKKKIEIEKNKAGVGSWRGESKAGEETFPPTSCTLRWGEADPATLLIPQPQAWLKRAGLLLHPFCNAL